KTRAQGCHGGGFRPIWCAWSAATAIRCRSRQPHGPVSRPRHAGVAVSRPPLAPVQARAGNRRIARRSFCTSSSRSILALVLRLSRATHTQEAGVDCHNNRRGGHQHGPHGGREQNTEVVEHTGGQRDGYDVVAGGPPEVLDHLPVCCPGQLHDGQHVPWVGSGDSTSSDPVSAAIFLLNPRLTGTVMKSSRAFNSFTF